MCQHNCNDCNPCQQTSSCNCRYNGPAIDQLGITTGMPYDEVIEILTTYVSDIDFSDGIGIQSTSYNAGTGVLTLTFTDGTTYSTGDLRGPTGATGATGSTGPIGPAGPQGPGDGYTAPYKYSDSTAGFAGNGYLSATDTNFANVTEVYIAKVDAASVNNQPLLLSFANPELNVISGVNNRYGILKFFKQSNQNSYVNYEIIGVINDTTHVTFGVKYLDHVGTFALDDDIYVSFKPHENVTSELRYDIVNWNMDTTSIFNIPIIDLVPHGCSPDRIVDVSVMIVSDNIVSPTYIPLDRFDTQSNGSVLLIDGTNIVLSRTTGGVFDDPNYSGTGARGYALIKYFKI